MANYLYTYEIQAYDREGRPIGRPCLRMSEISARVQARYRSIPADHIEVAYNVRVTRRLVHTYTDEPVMMVWFDTITGQPKVSKRKEDLIK